eukprot:COSAG02_NODE_957_length_15660_cov_23.265793_7_plen_343_part_00
MSNVGRAAGTCDRSEPACCPINYQLGNQVFLPANESDFPINRVLHFHATRGTSIARFLGLRLDRCLRIDIIVLLQSHRGLSVTHSNKIVYIVFRLTSLTTTCSVSSSLSTCIVSTATAPRKLVALPKSWRGSGSSSSGSSSSCSSSSSSSIVFASANCRCKTQLRHKHLRLVQQLAWLLSPQSMCHARTLAGTTAAHRIDGRLDALSVNATTAVTTVIVVAAATTRAGAERLGGLRRIRSATPGRQYLCCGRFGQPQPSCRVPRHILTRCAIGPLANRPARLLQWLPRLRRLAPPLSSGANRPFVTLATTFARASSAASSPRSRHRGAVRRFQTRRTRGRPA